MELAGQLVAVQVLDATDQLGGVDPVDVDDLGLHRALDGVGQTLDGRHGLLAHPRRMRPSETGSPKATSTRPRKDFRDLEGEPDGNQASGERSDIWRTGAALGFVVERDPSRAGLDPLDASFRRGWCPPDRSRARGPRREPDGPRRTPRRCDRAVSGSPAADGRGWLRRGPGAGEDGFLNSEALARNGPFSGGGGDQERVDQVVRMVDAEEDRPPTARVRCLRTATSRKRNQIQKRAGAAGRCRSAAGSACWLMAGASVSRGRAGERRPALSRRAPGGAASLRRGRYRNRSMFGSRRSSRAEPAPGSKR